MSDNYSAQPSLPDLLELLESLTNWQQFGFHLPGITDPVIQKIEKGNPKHLESQKSELFSEWLKVDPTASWKKVIIALRRANEPALASQIEQETGITVPMVLLQTTKGKMSLYL